VRQFKWIDWNLQKINARGLSAEEVEAAFDDEIPNIFGELGEGPIFVITAY